MKNGRFTDKEGSTTNNYMSLRQELDWNEAWWCGIAKQATADVAEAVSIQ